MSLNYLVFSYRQNGIFFGHLLANGKEVNLDLWILKLNKILHRCFLKEETKLILILAKIEHICSIIYMTVTICCWTRGKTEIILREGKTMSSEKTRKSTWAQSILKNTCNFMLYHHSTSHVYLHYSTCVLRYTVLSSSLWPHGLWPTRFLCSWDSTSKNTGVGGQILLQVIFLTQGSKLSLLCLLHWRWILYHCTAWEAPLF